MTDKRAEIQYSQLTFQIGQVDVDIGEGISHSTCVLNFIQDARSVIITMATNGIQGNIVGDFDRNRMLWGHKCEKIYV